MERKRRVHVKFYSLSTDNRKLHNHTLFTHLQNVKKLLFMRAGICQF